MTQQLVKISLERDNLLSEHAQRLLKEFYMLDSEASPQEAYARAAIAWSGGDNQLAQRLYDAASKNWFVFASPVLSNAPTAMDKNTRGLPISCFLSYVGDHLHSLIDHSTETRWLSVKGGGVGGHWSDVRAISDIAPGPIPFIHTIDADTIAYRQGKTRKGSYAAYLDISHPDIVEFLHIRIPTSDINRKCINIHHAINISDAFMDAVASNKEWKLVDPKTKEVRDVLPARQLWEQILEIRYRTGEPYLNFIDTANKHLPKQLKEKGLKIHGSNLCNEIHLPTNDERTAVCCLSSLNLEYYDEWQSTNLVADLVRMLDNVLEYFIKHAPVELSKAVKSAYNERSIGLGAMGWHSWLQSKGIAFESNEAGEINEKVFKEIKEKAVEASKRLAHERGEAPDMAGSGKRNAHLLAIAPNANSSIIADTSPSIEPWHSNAFVHRTRAGSYLVKNKFLETVLDAVNQNNDKTWSSIISSGGSIQHLEFLDARTKAVFRTAMEIDQDWVIRHASDRQKYICQGQSVNLFFPSAASRAYINRTHISAWKNGLKGLYYLRTEASSRTEEVGTKVERVALKDAEAEGQEQCSVCVV
jgi:ribonucleoside-diphosphate reductase alpha chain